MARKNGQGSVWTDANGYHHFKIQTSVVQDNGKPYIIHTTSTVSEDEAMKKGLKKKKDVERKSKLTPSQNYTGKELLEKVILDYCNFKLEKDVSKHRWTASTYTTNTNLLNARIKNFGTRLAKTQLKNLNQKLFQEYYLSLVQDGYNRKGCENLRLLLIKTLDFVNKQGLYIENYAALAVIPNIEADEVPDDYAGGEEDSKDVFTEEEIVKIWEGCKTNVFKYGYGYGLMLATGIRGQELRAITRDLVEIDEEKNEGKIYICKSIGRRKNAQTGKKELYMKVTKTTDTRYIYLDAIGVECVKGLMDAMKLYNANVDNPKNLLMYDQFGKFVDGDVFNAEFHRFCIRFGIDLPAQKGAHMLRHTFVTHNNIKSAVNPLITAAAVGHKNLATDLNVYTHVSMEDIKKHISNPLNNEEKSEDINPAELKEIYEKLKAIFEG